MTDSAPTIEPISVSELTGHIKAVVEETFPPVWVAGEISDLSRPRSGHIYFTLKDESAQIRGVIWRSTASRIKTELNDGQAIVCLGNLEVYAARGTYQIVVRQVVGQGLGELQQRFQRLQTKLESEGLFSAESKRALPRFPKSLAVITSPSGAAVRDFLKAASVRWPGVGITVVPAVVQGQGSVLSLVDAMKAAHRLKPRPDVIVLTRGGGSLEDLWSFNEERLVRAVAKSKIPTVSAIGHEVDITLCDLAADVRALTPTDAATKVLADFDLISKTTENLSARINRAMEHSVAIRLRRLQELSQRPVFRKPHDLIHQRWRLLDEYDARARRSINQRLQHQEARLGKLASALSALSPLDVLTRGYSVTQDGDGNAIRDASDLRQGQTVTTRLNRGTFRSVVSEIDNRNASPE